MERGKYYEVAPIIIPCRDPSIFFIIPLLNTLSLGSSLSMGDKVPHTHTHTHTHTPGNKTAVQCVVLCMVPDNKLEEKPFWIEWFKPLID